MSKLDDEKAAAVTAAKTFFQNWKDSIERHAPRWLLNLIDAIIRHPGTPWFFLGSAVEALGLVFQFQYLGVSYPIWDFVGGMVFFLVIAALQRRPEYAPLDDGDDDDADEDSTP